MRIKKGDYVQVISGSETGKRGRVLRVLPRKGKVIIEGINYIYRHLKKSQKSTQGGRIQKEAAIQCSNVMLYDPNAQKPTRTFYRYEEVADKGKEKTEPEKAVVTAPVQGEAQSQAPQDVVKRVKHIKVRYAKASNRQI